MNRVARLADLQPVPAAAHTPRRTDASDAAAVTPPTAAATPSCDWCGAPRAHLRTNLCQACLVQFWDEAYDLTEDIGRGTYSC